MIKMINGIMRTWSWWKGFAAGCITFIAFAAVAMAADENIIIRNVEKGKKKMVL